MWVLGKQNVLINAIPRPVMFFSFQKTFLPQQGAMKGNIFIATPELISMHFRYWVCAGAENTAQSSNFPTLK